MLLFNTLSKKKEKFESIHKKNILLYVCGITPYDTTHIGHAFLYMFFDVVVRYLSYKECTVNYVQNVTDIDDDILKRAKEERRDWKELGHFWTKRFLNDYRSLNMRIPTHYVKAMKCHETQKKDYGNLLKRNELIPGKKYECFKLIAENGIC